MSARARRALREQELTSQSQTPNSSGSEDEAPATNKTSLFALLGKAEDEGGEDEEPEDEEEAKGEIKPEQKPVKKKSKNRRKKKKGKGAETVKEEGVFLDDDFDTKLAEASLEAPRYEGTPLSSVLKVETKNFDASAEMRILFGRAAMPEAGSEAFQGRSGGRQRGGMRGRDGRIISIRRNLFIQPKGTWPNAASGGLGMEVISVGVGDGPTEFRFVHSTAYQDVQRQFQICVEAMDPDRMVQLLHHNPYHIATLLQVSEILSQQRNHEASGDFLERALFTFGRSVNSLFGTKLSEGNARLSFLTPENREFWLACWRYIFNLAMRGTWRAAEEFGRMLLALDPKRDPYQICLLIDLLALKARQPERFLTLVEHPEFIEQHAHLPNIAFSTALAYQQLRKDALAREYLAKAITRFPWVLKKLFVDLSIRHQPNSPLAAEIPPPDTLQNLLCELYVERTRDLWKGTDTKQLLAEVVSTTYSLPKKSFRAPPKADSYLVEFDGVSVDVARHILQTDNRGLIQHLPREWTKVATTSYDPLPPGGDSSSSALQNLISSISPALRQMNIRGDRSGGVGEHAGLEEEELRRILIDFGLDEDRMGEAADAGGRNTAGGNATDENSADGGEATAPSTIQSILDFLTGGGRAEGGTGGN